MNQTTRSRTSDAAPVVEVRNLSKRFGNREVVRGIDFQIGRGECLGFLGPNGAGKTTSIFMLLGLIKKSAGKCSIFSLPVPEKLREIKRRTGVAPQADSLDPDLTVEENLFTYAAYFGIPERRVKQLAEELLDFFALQNRRREVIDHLSGGQRRRLLLARALINEPELLILDEPTIGLDPQARHLIWKRLAELQARGTTMLLTSHYMEEVARLSHRVLIMDEGCIIAQGEPQRMINDLVGRDVFEVSGSEEELRELEKALASCQAKVERTTDTMFIYTQEHCPELETLVRATKGWLRRPANLEDLFLQLTGRSLREAQ